MSVDVTKFISRALERYEDRQKSAKERLEKERATIERNAGLVERLRLVGVEVEVDDTCWGTLLSVEVNLGERPKTKKGRREFAAKLAAVRRAVGEPIKVTDRTVFNAKRRLVKMFVTAEGYPDVWFNYVDKLPRGSKCRIKKTVSKWTEHKLVCSN